jgi:hypothetical protein
MQAVPAVLAVLERDTIRIILSAPPQTPPAVAQQGRGPVPAELPENLDRLEPLEQLLAVHSQVQRQSQSLHRQAALLIIRAISPWTLRPTLHVTMKYLNAAVDQLRESCFLHPE